MVLLEGPSLQEVTIECPKCGGHTQFTYHYENGSGAFVEDQLCGQCQHDVSETMPLEWL